MNKFYPLLVYEFPNPEAAKLVSFSRLGVLVISAGVIFIHSLFHSDVVEMHKT
jgi:hypothetical protein